MEHIISTFLSLSPLKLGLFSLTDYIAVLRKDKTYRAFNTLLSIFVDIIYLIIFIYIHRFLSTNNLTEGFEYNRPVKIAVTIITVIVLITIASLYIADKNGNNNNDEIEENKVKKHIKDVTGIPDKILDKIEVIFGVLFLCYLLYDIGKSSIRFSKGEYVMIIDFMDIYFTFCFLSLVMILKLVKIYGIMS